MPTRSALSAARGGDWTCSSGLSDEFSEASLWDNHALSGYWQWSYNPSDQAPEQLLCADVQRDDDGVVGCDDVGCGERPRPTGTGVQIRPFGAASVSSPNNPDLRHIGGSRRAVIKSFRSVGNPDHGRAGRQPGRMFMHRQRWAWSSASAADRLLCRSIISLVSSP
jgi:hypothetical protein